MRRLVVLFVLVSACESTPASTTVAVRTLDRSGHSVAGVRVFGHDPAGAAIGDTFTDVDGRAALEMPAGGSVTTHDMPTSWPPDGITDRWYTVVGVEGGDELAIPIERVEVRARSLELTVPRLPPGADGMLVATACYTVWTTEIQTSVGLDERCPARSPLVVTATDGFGTPIAYLWLADIDLTQGTFELVGVWQRATGSEHFEVSGFGSTGGSIDLTRDTMMDGYRMARLSGAIDSEGPRVVFDTPRPAFGDRVVRDVHIVDAAGCVQRRRAYRASQSDLGRFTFDLGQLPPPLADPTFADHQLTWSGGAADGVATTMVKVAFATNHIGTWRTVTPPGVETVRYPADVGFPWPDGTSATFVAMGVSSRASTRWPYAESRLHNELEPLPIEDDFVETAADLFVSYGQGGCPQP